MKKNVLLLILSITITLSFAQRTKAVYGGFGWFESGIQLTDLENLNNELKTVYGTDLNETFITYGGGGFGVMKNLMIGGEGKGFQTNSASGNNTSITITGGYGLFDVGYVVYHNRKLSVFPKIGFGAGGLTLETADKDSEFGDALSLGSTSTMTYDTYLLDAGFGLLYQVSNWMLGLRAGYLYALSDDKWVAAEVDLDKGPAINLTGLYVKLTIGGGGIGRY
ncbi:MAG: hypothetical protein JXR56_03455 [Candidatus Cloacimonetes bacterium]|nr:hypothetical protein [Candidatus Cloacimonadota bacterium]